MASQQLPAWHVLGDQIREQASLAPSGNGIETMWEVPYQIDSGPARGSQHVVRLEPRNFHPADVQAAIEEHLSDVHGAASLAGGRA